MNKAEILREIRRTAASNGGVPLGWRKFASESKIPESVWLGKIWARWSDALREAGFSPNELKGAYDTSDLLERYARLAQELRKLPTANDLRLKDRREADFPNAKVYERLGNKSEIVAMLRQFCETRPEFADVAALCDAYVPPTSSAKNTSITEQGQEGDVYLIKSGRFFKIGRSNSVGRREYEVALQLPEKATTIHVIRTDDPPGIEAYWHRRFEAKRKNGEWFALDASDVAAFRRRKSM